MWSREHQSFVAVTNVVNNKGAIATKLNLPSMKSEWYSHSIDLGLLQGNVYFSKSELMFASILCWRRFI